MPHRDTTLYNPLMPATPVRLAIDGQALAGDRPTGLGRVARAATAGLSHDPSLELLPVMPPRPQGWSRSWERWVWEQTILPCKVQEARADVLYSPAFGAPRLSSCPRILMVHDLIPLTQPWETGGARWYWAHYLPQTATWAEAVITNSRQTRLELLRAVPVDPARVFVCPLGAPWEPGADPPPVAAARWLLERPVEGSYALWVGSLVARKAPRIALQAIAHSARQGLPIPLLLVGTGPEEAALRAESAMLGISHLVHWLGFVGDDALLHAIYCDATVLLAPSLAEGFNLPLVEAAAAGCPAITTALPVHEEVLGAAGTYVPVGDALALAQALASVWNDSAQRQMLSRRALEQAAGYRWSRHAAGIALLARCLAQRAPLPAQQVFAEALRFPVATG